MVSLKALTIILLGTVTAAADWPAAGKCTGECYAHDPSIVQRESDGKYFKFTTREFLEYASSDSLEGPWKIVGKVLPKGSKLKAGYGVDNNVWAPDCSKKGDKYYCYYAISGFGGQKSAIGLATSDDMEPDNWTDLGGIGVSSKAGDKYNAIDPNLFQAKDGNFLTFGSFWQDIFQTTLNDGATKANNIAPYNIETNTTGSHASEGPFIWQDGKHYYLFWSSGKCCNMDTAKPVAGEEYKMMVCRSDNLKGPYSDKNGRSCITQNGGTEIFGSHDNVFAPGGQGVFKDKTRGTVIYYHYLDPSKGMGDGDSIFGWNVLKFENGWPVLQ